MTANPTPVPTDLDITSLRERYLVDPVRAETVSYMHMAIAYYKPQALAYIPMNGRPDPFDIFNAVQTLEQSGYSPILGRAIFSIDDVMALALAMCAAWAEEDKNLVVMSHNEGQPETPAQAVAHNAVDTAHKEWKEAVAQQTEAIASWKKYVADKKAAYKSAQAAHKVAK